MVPVGLKKLFSTFSLTSNHNHVSTNNDDVEGQVGNFKLGHFATQQELRLLKIRTIV